jgi:hypothetical protein
MPASIESGYENFIRSKLKARNDFLLRYGELYPSLIPEPDKDFLRNNFLKDASPAQLEATELRLQRIELQIEELLRLNK